MRIVFELLIAILFVSLATYIGGRILLPSMGLTAPGYGTWLSFWSVIFALLAAAGAIISAVRG